MDKVPPSRDELADIATSLEALSQCLRNDLAIARLLPGAEIRAILRRRSSASLTRTEELARRIRALRDVVNSHRRTLDRLRAQMHQIRGGARPH